MKTKRNFGEFAAPVGWMIIAILTLGFFSLLIALDKIMVAVGFFVGEIAIWFIYSLENYLGGKKT